MFKVDFAQSPLRPLGVESSRVNISTIMMTSFVSSALDSLRSFTGSVAWAPLVQLSRSSILSLMKGIEVGQLTIREKDGTETLCGKSAEGRDPWPVTSLNVVREAFWLRLAFFADMVSWPSVWCPFVELRSLPGFRGELYAR